MKKRCTIFTLRHSPFRNREKASDLLEAQSLYQKTMDEMTEAKCNFQVQKAKYLQATGMYH